MQDGNELAPCPQCGDRYKGFEHTRDGTLYIHQTDDGEERRCLVSR